MKLTEKQSDAVETLSKKNVGYVVGKPSSGKTIVALSVLKKLLDSGEITQALVVAPPNVVVSAWKKDIERWPALIGITFCVISGNVKQRVKKLKNTTVQIRIISDNLVPWIVLAALQLKIDLGQAIVVDEITRWGSAGSCRVRAVRKYRGGAGFNSARKDRWKYSYGLTATPVSESWEGLYAHFLTLDQGARLGTRLDNYCDEYFYDTSRDSTYKMLVLKSNGAERISRCIEDAIYRLPQVNTTVSDKKVTHTNVQQSSDDTRLMREMKKNSSAFVRGEKIVAVNAAVLSAKLAQMTCGGVYLTNDDDKKPPSWVEINRTKIEYAEKRVRELAPKNVIIVYQYRFELEWLKEAFSSATVLTGLSATALSDAINRDDTTQKGRVLLLHPQSAGHGVDGLQFGFSEMLWLAPPWSRELWTQVCGRVCRIGQKNTVNVEVLSVGGSVDEVKWRAIESKASFEVLFDHFLRG